MASRMLHYCFRLHARNISRIVLQNGHHRPILSTGQTFPRRRQMSILNEFSKRVKEELESNPELKKSMKELKEKADELKEITGDLKIRTKQTTEQLYKQADAVRMEAEVKAKQVSTAMKEKLSAATEQAKEFRETFKSKTEETEGKAKFEAHKSDEQASFSATSQGAQKIENTESRSETAEADKTLFTKFGAGISNAASTTLKSLKEAKVLEITKKGYDLIKKELTTSHSRRQRAKTAAEASSYTERSSRTDMVPVFEKKSRVSKKLEELKEKVENHPLYKRIRGVSKHPAIEKGQEIAEDLRERWETSDSPVVHKIQDLNDTIFGESDTAISYKEIRRRDPYFSLPDFIEDVQQMVKPTLEAYSKGDLEALRKHCTFEVIDRCKAERKAYASQGLFFDNKILHISEVEVKETKLMGNVPIIIVTFRTQQIYCVRDRNGKITAGAEDDIHTVYYAWAMQQTDSEQLKEGEFYPSWKLREMQQLGIKSLI